ncbi:MAG: chemotaxis protein CheA, partial [Pseudomonadota bacterium]
MELDAIRDTYFAECADQLSELETGLFSISSDGVDAETVNSVFRAVHSIKGGAGAFALDELVSFAHVFENALDVIRNDLSQSNEDRIELLLRSSDVLTDIVAAARDGEEPIDCSEISAELEKEFNLQPMEEEEEVEFDIVPISLDDLTIQTSAATNKFEITFAPHNELYLNGHDPQKIFRELADLGSCEIRVNSEKLSSLDKFDTSSTELSWNITIETTSLENDVRAVFEWVSDCCDLEITEDETDALASDISIDDFLGDLSDLPEVEEEDDCLGEPQESEPLTVPDEQPQIAELPDISEVSPEPALEIVAEEPAAEVVELPAEAPKEEKPVAAKKPETKERARTSKPIRVDSEKVDRLINLMGEMVISQSMLKLQINEAGFGTASPTGLALVELQNLTREIQSSVMSIRAQPIKPVFMRMSRVVREICSATGKKAQLLLEGENTEVDTTVIEGLSDPLTHMIRNSVDHGIESVEKRVEAGKPETGEIVLSASHSSGSIVIEIRDDGAGINRQKVFEIAVEKGVIQADSKLSDEEIDNLIFAPGFSTAEEITDVSGRGVGMDVVRQSIQGLGGRVSISSTPGKGSLFTLNLPLTLAILDGMLVRTAEQMFVIPVSSMIETISLRQQDVFQIGDGNMVFKLRDQLIPIVDVGYELGFLDQPHSYEEGTILIVESGNHDMSAFLVDSIVGQQ